MFQSFFVSAVVASLMATSVYFAKTNTPSVSHASVSPISFYVDDTERIPADDGSAKHLSKKLQKFTLSPEFQQDAQLIAGEQLIDALNALDNSTEDQLRLMLIEEADRIQKVRQDNSALPEKTREMLLSYEDKLRDLAKRQNLKKHLKEFMHGTWKATSAVGGVLVRTTAHMANFIDLTVSFPFRFVFKFTRGLATGIPDRPRGQNAYEFLMEPSNRNGTNGLLNMLTYYSVYAFWTGDIASGALFGAPVVDFFAAAYCDKENLTNPRGVRFCGNLKKVKDVVYEATTAGDKGGAALHEFIEKNADIMFRQDDKISEALCTAKEKRQVRVASRVLRRHLSEYSALEGFQSIGVAMLSENRHPLQKRCIAIVVTLDAPDEEQLAVQPSVIDGIHVYYNH